MKYLFKLPVIFLILFSANLLALTDDETLLFSAVQNGDTESIKELILAQVNVNVVDEEGYTPLHRAVFYNKLESVNELLAYAKTDKEARLPENAVINNWYMYGATPLILASYLGYTDIAESLIKYKANIKARDSIDGTMSIHIATANRHAEVIKLLLLNDKKLVQALDNHNNTPLHWTSMSDHTAVVAILLENGADKNAENIAGVKPIDHLTSNRDIIDLLADSKTQSDTKVYTPKTIDTKMDETDTTTDNTNNKTNPIIFKIDAVDKSSEIAATTVINPDVKNLELIVAVKEGDIISIKRLLKEGVSPNFTLENGYTPLHTAIYENKMESIEELLLYEDLEIDIMGNIPLLSNWEFGYSTPLFLASALGHNEATRLLLDNNANIFYKNEITGIMPIHLASYYKHDDIVSMLIKKDYSIINAYSSDNRAPLHYAVMSGSSELTSTLLGYHGINYDTKDILSKTPLHYAVAIDNLEIVKLLVNKNADKTIKDSEGYTPYLLAISLGHKDIVDFLKDSDKVKWWKIN